MKILETLNNDKMSAKDKLKEIKALVKGVRAEYGNEDVEVPTVKVHTTEGAVSISLLTNEEKVAVSTNEIKRCISQATAVADNVEGAVFDRSFEFAVATNNVLANIGEKSTSKY